MVWATLLMLGWHAETGIADEPGWTWKQCVAAVEEQPPPELAAARHASESAQSRLAAAKAAFLPKIDFMGGAGIVEDTDEEASGATDGYLAMVTGELPLYPNRARKGLRQLREAESLAAGSSGEQAHAAFLFRLRMAFLDLLHAQESLQVAKDIQEHLHLLATEVETRHRAGQEHQGNAAVSRSALAGANNEVEQASRNLDFRRDRLNALMGCGTDPVERVTGQLECDSPPENPDELDTLILNAPAYAAARIAVQTAKARVAAIRGQRDWQLDAMGRATPHSDSWNRDEPDWFVGVRLTVPLYEGGQNRRKVEAAESDVRQAESKLLSVQRDLLLEFHSARTEVQAAASRLALQKETVENARLRADIARREYEAGLTSLAPWESAEKDCAEKLRAALQVRHTAAVAQARWEHLLGATKTDSSETQGTP